MHHTNLKMTGASGALRATRRFRAGTVRSDQRLIEPGKHARMPCANAVVTLFTPDQRVIPDLKRPRVDHLELTRADKRPGMLRDGAGQKPRGWSCWQGPQEPLGRRRYPVPEDVVGRAQTRPRRQGGCIFGFCITQAMMQAGRVRLGDHAGSIRHIDDTCLHQERGAPYRADRLVEHRQQLKDRVRSDYARPGMNIPRHRPSAPCRHRRL